MAVHAVADEAADSACVRDEEGDAVTACLSERDRGAVGVAGSDDEVGARVERGEALTTRGFALRDETVNLDEAWKAPGWHAADHMELCRHSGAVHFLGGSNCHFAPFSFPFDADEQQGTSFGIPTFDRRKNILAGWFVGHVCAERHDMHFARIDLAVLEGRVRGPF